MKYLSLFSGIEAASCAWQSLGWELVGVSEIEKFPCNVLKHHFPDVPNLGDITKITDEDLKKLGHIDLIVGGSPCQGFSVAGKQGGLNDVRSGLATEYIRILCAVRPRWIVWENVPGVFSTNGGMDFKYFIKEITDIGYGLCWRVLDAQYFGVAQRRRRVFLVGYLGDWRPTYEVLFESESLSGYLKTLERTQQRIARGATHSARETSSCLNPWSEQSKRVLRTDGVCDCLCASEKMKSITKILDDRTCVNPWDPQGKRISTPNQKSPCLDASAGAGGNTTPLVYDMNHPCDVIRTYEDGKTPTLEARMGTGGNNIPLILNTAFGGSVHDKASTLDCRHEQQCVCTTKNSNTLDASDPSPACQQGGIAVVSSAAFKSEQGSKARGIGWKEEQSPTLTFKTPAVCVQGSVIGRKPENSPQGDGINVEKSFTLNTIDRHAVCKEAKVRKLTPTECLRLQGFPDNWFDGVEGYSDTAAYKAIGNSMAVPCMHWIGEQIERVMTDAD